MIWCIGFQLYLNQASHVLNKKSSSGKATAKISSHLDTCAKNNCTSFEEGCGSPGWIDRLIEIACGWIVRVQTAVHTQSGNFGKTRQNLKFALTSMLCYIPANVQIFGSK